MKERELIHNMSMKPNDLFKDHHVALWQRWEFVDHLINLTRESLSNNFSRTCAEIDVDKGNAELIKKSARERAPSEKLSMVRRSSPHEIRVMIQRKINGILDALEALLIASRQESPLEALSKAASKNVASRRGVITRASATCTGTMHWWTPTVECAA